jgi:hypothetical protein
MGKNDMPGSTGDIWQVQERHDYALFVSQHAVEDYRSPLAELYARWRGFNQQFFGGQMVEPHLVLGRTAPRSLGQCSRTTGYGGMVQISFNARLVFGTNKEWVVQPWPAEGARRFLEDLLLRLTVRQLILEAHDEDESGYQGFGPLFVAQANRIGATLGLAEVVCRRRGPGDTRPVASGWPHCVRPAGYYAGAVTEAALALACGGGTNQAEVLMPGVGLAELFAYLCTSGKTAQAQGLAAEYLAWTRAWSQSEWPKRKAVEAGLQDVDGSPLGAVPFCPQWLEWNGGTVLRLAEEIDKFRNYAQLPLLALALEEAGCQDGRILRHLRARMAHGRGCWVLRGLLARDAEPIPEQRSRRPPA